MSLADLGNWLNGWTGEERGGAGVRAGEDAMQVTRREVVDWSVGVGVQAVTGSVEMELCCRHEVEDTKFWPQCLLALGPPTKFTDRRAETSLLSQFQISHNLELTL